MKATLFFLLITLTSIAHAQMLPGHEAQYRAALLEQIESASDPEALAQQLTELEYSGSAGETSIRALRRRADNSEAVAAIYQALTQIARSVRHHDDTQIRIAPLAEATRTAASNHLANNSTEPSGTTDTDPAAASDTQ